MSLFDYLFDSEYKQRRDIEAEKVATDGLSSEVDGVSHGVGQLRNTVRELSGTVHVLVQMLSERGGLDLHEFKTRLDQELNPRSHARRMHDAAAASSPKPPPVVYAGTCVKCGIMSENLIKVGSELWCRDCAANP